MRPRRPAKKPSTSPTERTLSYLRSRGWIADVVERWIPIPKHPAGGKRRDLWHFGDVLAANPREGRILIVQATSGTNLADRVKKILSTPEALDWLRSGGEVEAWGWRKLKKPPPGESARRQWFPLIRPVTLAVEPEPALWHPDP